MTRLKTKRTISYLVCAAFLIYYGLEDFEHFNIIYNGLPLGLGVTAVVLAIMESRSDKK